MYIKKDIGYQEFIDNFREVKGKYHGTFTDTGIIALFNHYDYYQKIDLDNNNSLYIDDIKTIANDWIQFNDIHEYNLFNYGSAEIELYETMEDIQESQIIVYLYEIDINNDGFIVENL